MPASALDVFLIVTVIAWVLFAIHTFYLLMKQTEKPTMPKNEQTSPEVASAAGSYMYNSQVMERKIDAMRLQLRTTYEQTDAMLESVANMLAQGRSIASSALTQAPDKESK